MANQDPFPRLHYQVDWAGARLNFAEVTGLDQPLEAIESRNSDSKDFSEIKMPGMRKFSNITMKRGTFEADFSYDDWLDEIANERTTARREVVIRLFNEKHEPVAVWKAASCFPVKITAPDLKADANEVAIETIEIAHEGLCLVR